jgi:hypothetical protein
MTNLPARAELYTLTLPEPVVSAMVLLLTLTTCGEREGN